MIKKKCVHYELLSLQDPYFIKETTMKTYFKFYYPF